MLSNAQTLTGSARNKALAALALGALGVVYGDIGTSPLYAVQVTFGEQGIPVSPENVLGVLSLIFWSLVLVVSLKYVVFIMRADNKGEGGIMALMALAQRGTRDNVRLRRVIVVLGLFGASLFYGDGVITPAVSILSAVEGVKVAAPALDSFIVPITLVIVIALFAVQKRGTATVGAMFGPIMMLWFAALAALGAWQIVQQPQVLYALNPWHAVVFFRDNGAHAFLALGGVVLCLTGAEALYADMGHFGKEPIRIAWFGYVSPALVLNYFGQGALLMHQPDAVSNPFFLMAPQSLLYPMIALATVAAIIASQAVITGAFSMTREAIQLGFAPRMAVKHTSKETQGQIFLPWVNSILMVLILGAVLGFRSSANLAAAYGIAVTGTMAVSTCLACVVARRIWGWNRVLVAVLGLLFLTVDIAYFSANAIKIEHGGWFPLVLGLCSFLIMSTWRKGRELVLRELRQGGIALEPFVESVVAHPPLRVPGTAVFLTANISAVPNAMLHNLKHNKVLHERNILMTVETLDVPTAEYGERTEITALGHEFYRVVLRYGFAEDPDIPVSMQNCEAKGLGFDMMDTTFFLSRENVVASAGARGMPVWRDKLFAFLTRNASPATAFFRIPGNRMIELGTQVEI
ncbi:MAG: potassium transporter Kup [Proteobacteria bacterium]|uniref:potassium transporter Kup n=1 Tax=Rudaea sp. TaxID=2136325 RepID=UPI001DBAC357|nr:potassium transporter Kup [Pseudomonadota bacterium]MBS0566992.1 potassium transporter Kup [Pseudomonadota bacterium]